MLGAGEERARDFQPLFCRHNAMALEKRLRLCAGQPL